MKISKGVLINENTSKILAIALIMRIIMKNRKNELESYSIISKKMVAQLNKESVTRLQCQSRSLPNKGF